MGLMRYVINENIIIINYYENINLNKGLLKTMKIL